MTNTPEARPRLLFLFLVATILVGVGAAALQSPTPTPAPERAKPASVGRIIVGESTHHDVSPPLRDLVRQQNRHQPPDGKQHIVHPNPTRDRPYIFPLFHPELRYRLFDRFTHLRFCDPYGASPASEAAEKRDALFVFHKIQEDGPTFAAITQHLRLNGKRELSDDDKLAIYLQYVKLQDTVRLLPADSGYTFELLRRVDKPQKPGWGVRVIGVITPSGKINVVRTEPAPVYCPGSRQVD